MQVSPAMNKGDKHFKGVELPILMLSWPQCSVMYVYYRSQHVTWRLYFSSIKAGPGPIGLGGQVGWELITLRLHRPPGFLKMIFTICVHVLQAKRKTLFILNSRLRGR